MKETLRKQITSSKQQDCKGELKCFITTILPKSLGGWWPKHWWYEFHIFISWRKIFSWTKYGISLAYVLQLIPVKVLKFTVQRVFRTSKCFVKTLMFFRKQNAYLYVPCGNIWQLPTTLFTSIQLQDVLW